MIPVLGVPILNGTYWLHRLISSVDFPVDTFIIFNNGNKEIREELDSFTKMKHPYINKIEICHLPTNLGVSAVWNLIIKSFTSAPFWVITNHDISFTPGSLEKLYNKSIPTKVGIVNASNQSFDLFLIKDFVIEKIGLFDENLSPAYCEDVDYVLRMEKYNKSHVDKIIRVCVDCPKGSHPYYHGHYLSNDEECYSQGGSQTKKSNPEVANKITQIHQHNYEYMNRKWGFYWENLFENVCNGLEINATQNEQIPQYDLPFIKMKNLI
jgi:hypothetical protein